MDVSQNVQNALREYDLERAYDLLYACDLTTEQGRVDFSEILTKSVGDSETVYDVWRKAVEIPKC